MQQHYFYIGTVVFLLFITSCDPCDDVTCINGEPKEVDNNECICECDQGYEGDQCGEAANKKFIGTYTAYDTCGGYVYGPRKDIKVKQLNNSPFKVTINEFASLSGNVVVEAKTRGDTIILLKQTVDGYHFDRSMGKLITDNDFVLPYSFTSDQGGDTCTALYTKQ